jgi:deferrochelatase/peroxidase EfeB
MSQQPAATMGFVELDDIQGLVRSGYGNMSEACFLLLRVKDRDAARAWLAHAPVTSVAEAWRDPRPAPGAVPKPILEHAMQIALTSEGLRKLGVAPEIVEGFSFEFVAGMSGDENRSRRLGDIGDSDPGAWEWGAAARIPHVLVMLYAKLGKLEALSRQVQAQCAAGFDLHLPILSTTDMDRHEPFGFSDGISQPKVDWCRERAARDQCELDYVNLSCLGEYLLGYPNEYGGYTDRPLLDAKAAGAAPLPRAEDAPDKFDLGRNGSYLVLRQLHQDVVGLWQFLDQKSGSDPATRQRWAEAMVGRTVEGEPLVGRRNTPRATAVGSQPDLNDFDFSSDPDGLKCPRGAHIRRVNPRNADLPPGRPCLLARLVRMLGFSAAAREKDLVASTRFHRLLRRGREYGEFMSVEEALAAASPGPDAGLHFICIGANIARQFEFVQSAWVMGTKFDGLRGEGDALLGHRQPDGDGAATDEFSLPQANGPDQRLSGLPRFVKVVGGAYFFLPGIRALRYFATAR